MAKSPKHSQATDQDEEDLYQLLKVDRSSELKVIKKAYYKLCLELHPDKLSEGLSESEREVAKGKFQKVGLAYSILSDPEKRKRYDQTGSITELDSGLGTFDEWSDYFQAQFGGKVTTESIDKFSLEYKGSEAERKDVLDAYTQSKGDMGKIMDCVMLSSSKDEDRFIEYVASAVKEGVVEEYKLFAKSTSKVARLRRIRKEEKEMKEAQDDMERQLSDDDASNSGESDTPEKSKSKKGRSDKGAGLGDLAELIQQRQLARQNQSGAFFDRLLHRYSRTSTSKPSSKTFRHKRTQSEDSIPEDVIPPKRKAKRTKD